MKRALFATLAALAFVTSAWAAPSDYVQQFRKPYAYRVAVVSDGRWDLLNQTNVKLARLNLERSFGNTIEMLTEQGAEVHYYSSDYFYRTVGTVGAGDTRTLWNTLGTYYPLVLMPGYAVDASSQRFFFCPDSTTAHIIHYGGANGISWSDSTMTGCRGWLEGGTDHAQAMFFSHIRGAVRAYGTTDTLWFQKASYGLRTTATLPLVPFALDSITSIVRLFEPLRVTAPVAFGGATSDTDTAMVRFPDVADSNAIARDVMPVAWRIYWNKVVGGVASTRSVDFVKSVPSATYQNNIGHVLYALCSRYVSLNPIRIAVDFDDVFDADTTGVPRATNAAWDSTFTALAAFGLKPGIAVNPQNASQYIQGADSTYEGTKWDGTVGAGINPWGSAAAWTWPNNRGISWVHHVHDSTRAGSFGNLIGRYGGYQSGNGSNTAQIANWGTIYTYSPRFANAQGAAVNQGIVQRLQRSDSLRAVRCPQCITPPYLNFPNNEMLPINWRARTGVANSAWGTTANLGSTTSNVGTANSSNGALDSLFYAFATGLKVPDRGTVYLRTPFVTATGGFLNYRTRGPGFPSGWGDNSIQNQFYSNDRDSMIAGTPFAYPGERAVARIANGGVVDVQALSTIAYDFGNASGSVDLYRQGGSVTLATLYGTRNPVQTSGHPAPIVGEVFLAVLGDSIWAGTYLVGFSNFRNFTSHQRSRIVYLHPSTLTSQFVNATGPKDSYAIDALTSGVLRGKKALDDIAGHITAIWVNPWEVMAKP